MQHHRGLATLFLTEMWERFSYYGTRALLILFMTASVEQGGFGFAPENAGAIYGLYTAGVYLCSLPGGWIADRLLGQRSAVFWGGVLIALGNAILAIRGSTTLFFIGLLVIALGTGLLKPNVSCMVGQLYDGQPTARRDAAFSVFYLGINLGAFIAPLIAGTLGETAGYRWGFLAASGAMTLGLIQYRTAQRWLGEIGRIEGPQDTHAHARNVRKLMVGATVVSTAVVVLATVDLQIDVQRLARVSGVMMLALGLGFFAYLFLSKALTTDEKNRTVIILLFFVSSTLFWAGYEQAGSTLNLFARDLTDRSFMGHWFASGAHPASWYQSAAPVFILMFAPLFAWLWIFLSKRQRDPTATTKFGLGLLQLGLSFIVMMLAAQTIARTGKSVLPTWLIVTYLLQTLGELCVSPIGLSSVTQLAPKRYVGQMMGTWFLAAALGNLAAGLIGGEIGALHPSGMSTSFFKMGVLAIGAAVLVLLIAKPLRRWAMPAAPLSARGETTARSS